MKLRFRPTQPPTLVSLAKKCEKLMKLYYLLKYIFPVDLAFIWRNFSKTLFTEHLWMTAPADSSVVIKGLSINHIDIH